MTLDDLTRTALIRGATAFAIVLVVGSTAVYTSGRLLGGSEGAPSPIPVSPSPAQPPASAAPDAWLAWVPGGLPDGFVRRPRATGRPTGRPLHDPDRHDGGGTWVRVVPPPAGTTPGRGAQPAT